MPYKSLYEFTITQEREVDETTKREEDGKTISETVKVKKSTKVWLSFKKPSRPERELAEEERAAWWSRYVEKGILPQAILLKTYANSGGILNKEDYAYYRTLEKEFLDTQKKIQEMYVNEKDKVQEIAQLEMRFMDIRNLLLEFEQKQSVFFDNTAEAKAKAKLINYLVLHMSYVKFDETKDWEPFFKGVTIEEKQEYFDKLEEDNDDLLSKSYQILYFVATMFSTQGGFHKDSFDEYLKTLGAE